MLYSYDWNIIADSIASIQKEISDSIYHNKIDLYTKLRKGYSIKRYIDSTALEGDTIIIMEYHNPYKLTANSVIWVKGKPSSFLIYDKYLNKERDITRCCWSVYLRKLCEDWNVTEIRKKERERPYEPISPLDKPSIIATKIILKADGVFGVDSIYFEYFEEGS